MYTCIQRMSNRLADLINEVLVKEGIRGRSRLALAADRGEKQIERYSLGKQIPSSDVAFKIALACGCGEREAHRIASEYASRAKERLPA